MERLSKRSLSSLVSDGGGVSVKIGVVVPAVVATIVVVHVRVIGFRGTALPLVVLMLSVAGSFGSSACFGGLFSFLEIMGLFFLSWSHKGCLMDGDGRFGS